MKHRIQQADRFIGMCPVCVRKIVCVDDPTWPYLAPHVDKRRALCPGSGVRA